MSVENSAKNSTTKQVGRPFKKGQSGNPGGRPKKPKELKEMADLALPRLWDMAQDPITPVKIRTDIYMWIHDKAYGKATQKIAGAEDGAPVIAVSMIPPDVKDYVG